MGILANPRHERFAQALFEGGTADAAYLKAGFKANRGNASRLKANENILARLAELQAAAAKASEVTVQSLLGELETARVRADNAEQFSASVRAIEAKARVSGLLTQRIEVTNVTEEFDNAEINRRYCRCPRQCHGRRQRLCTHTRAKGWLYQAIDSMDRGS